MDESSETLAEMMLHASQFCSRVEGLGDLLTDKQEKDEFRLKLGQARNTLERLQEAYNYTSLDLRNQSTAAEFRQLIISLLWAAFYVRKHLDFRLFRMIVSVEAAFTHLLLNRE